MMIFSYLQQILAGTWLTLQLMVCALIVGLFLAVLLTLCRISERRYLTWPAQVYIFAIRGTPLLVQFFLIYFGLSQFAFIRDSIFWVILAKPFACAVATLAINTSAYTAVLLYGAIQAIPKGEIEACKALGMSWITLVRRIVLPLAFRIALPAYSNEVVMILKGTSLASTITLMELFGVTKQLISETYAAIQFMLLAGLIYFLLNAVLIAGFRYLENRLQRDQGAYRNAF